jgi:LmbE family N-acetylglucosaminyl deacetylase
MDRPDIRENLTRIRRAEMAAARDILGVRQHFLGFEDSGLPRNGDALPDGCFAPATRREGSPPAGRTDPGVSTTGDRHVRRNRRLPAPGPHQDT